jgi:hypothetical protein
MPVMDMRKETVATQGYKLMLDAFKLFGISSSSNRMREFRVNISNNPHSTSLAALAHVTEGLFPGAILTVKVENSLICLCTHTNTNNVRDGIILPLKTSLNNKAWRCRSE